MKGKEEAFMDWYLLNSDLLSSEYTLPCDAAWNKSNKGYCSATKLSILRTLATICCVFLCCRHLLPSNRARAVSHGWGKAFMAFDRDSILLPYLTELFVTPSEMRHGKNNVIQVKKRYVAHHPWIILIHG